MNEQTRNICYELQEVSSEIHLSNLIVFNTVIGSLIWTALLNQWKATVLDLGWFAASLSPALCGACLWLIDHDAKDDPRSTSKIHQRVQLGHYLLEDRQDRNILV